MKTICIDPGHGGKQPGAIGPQGSRESDINLAVALKLKDLAKDKYNVVLTRETDSLLSTESVSADHRRRSEIASEKKADLYLSIHCNGMVPIAKGIETWYHNLATPRNVDLVAKNKKFATLIYEELTKTFPNNSKRGVHPDTERYKTGFGVLRPLEVPGAQVELEFITNPDMEKVLLDQERQEDFAKALLAAINRYMEG
jgi:N-acetylmuramoyl-L-alanine amidase